MHICWGAQAGLYYHYGIPKYPLDKKLFGVYSHQITDPKIPLFRGFDDMFFAPHSRHTENRLADFKAINDLKIAAYSDQAGVNVIIDERKRFVFITGHFEYNTYTLKTEYERDLAKGLPIELPVNYFANNDPKQEPMVRWRANGSLLYLNWLNYYVYQATPYNWS